MNSLEAVSPLDGRYFHKVNPHLSPYFSEMALMKTRVEVEIEYLIALLILNKDKPKEEWRQIYMGFKEFDAQSIKLFEADCKHDVKAVEYFLRTKIDKKYHPWIHFGLTSQDINQTALPLLLHRFNHDKMIPKILSLIESLWRLNKNTKDTIMLSRTHGQPASPTSLGKEMMVFMERLRIQFHKLEDFKFTAKLGGAVGNFNAHYAAFPNHNWGTWANHFIKSLGLNRTQITTQIEPYDNLAEYCQLIARVNTIFTDLVKDIWTYISMNYFKLNIEVGEVGSSTMPHKVNPIDFENAEGNLGVANALLNHFAAKLPISRLQRDLTDSTVTRNLGVAFGHSYLAYSSILSGLKKLAVNPDKIRQDLEMNWVVVAEGIQTILRRDGMEDAYEKLKKLTRNNIYIGPVEIEKWVEELDITEDVKTEILALTPFNYKGDI